MKSQNLNSKKISKILSEIRWDKDGLVACVVQDWEDHEVLMVAYMNKESFKKTILGERCCFWSRSRKKFWLKGEDSGNFQRVKSIAIDCDGDCLLIRVDQIGGAACHTGMRSCFYREVDRKEGWISIGKKVFDPQKIYKKS